MGSKELKDIANAATGFAVDTRLIKRGNLFFALPGAKTDGHAYLEVAQSLGASAAVVKSDYSGPDHGLRMVRVPDVLNALQTLAKDKIASGRARIVAVTGSLGKTTTKGFITTLLKHKYKVAASPGNSNSQIGLPLTILNHVHTSDEILILEMGMTHPGQIKQLVEIAPPEVAVVTTVALVHAGNFESLEGICRAKAEIFSHHATKFGIYHRESNINHVLGNTGICSKLSFSTASDGADYHLKGTKHGMDITEHDSGPVAFGDLPVPGLHNRHNFLAAVAVARYFGLSWEDIRACAEVLELPERRMQLVEKFGALFMNDSYNASEMSLKAALSSLPQPKPGGKRIAVIGAIVELGKFSDGCHKSVAEYALDHVDCMLCFGKAALPILETWKAAGRPVFWGEQRAEILQPLREMLKPGDVVLLKGSRDKDVGKVLDEL